MCSTHRPIKFLHRFYDNPSELQESAKRKALFQYVFCNAQYSLLTFHSSAVSVRPLCFQKHVPPSFYVQYKSRQRIKCTGEQITVAKVSRTSASDKYIYIHIGIYIYIYTHIGIYIGKSKAVPLQASSGPQGSRKLRFPDFMTTAQDGGNVVSFTHRPPLYPENTAGTHFC